MLIFRLRIFYVVALLSLNTLTTYSQKIQFKNYTSSSGIPSDEVYNLHQDKKGYIWLFTNYGTSKFNGKEFKQVLTNLSFNNSFIYCVYENEVGGMWVANSKGKIYEVRNDSAFQIVGTEKTSQLLKKSVSEIIQLVVDDTLNIYAITKHNSYKFKKKNNSYKPHLIKPWKNDSIQNHVYEINGVLFKIVNYIGKDTIPCGGFNNIKTLLFTNDKTVYVKFPCTSSDPKYFKRFNKDIYCSHHDKLVKITDTSNLIIPIKPIIANFTKDKNNHLWVACHNNGLFELNEEDSIVNHYFGKTTINDVLIDSQNGLWVSTAGEGLYYCRNLNDNYFSNESPLAKPISYLKIIENELFIANSIGDVFKVKNNKMLTYIKHDIEDEPLEFFKTKNDYILSFRYRFRQKEGFKTLDYLTGRKIVSIVKILYQNKDTMHFLARRYLCTITNDNKKKFNDFNFKVYSCETRNDGILISTENGIVELKNNTISQPKYLLATKNYLIKDIVKDELNNYWFCSIGGGLFKLQPTNELSHYTKESGLPSNIINNVFIKKNEILLSTNSGLFYGKPTSLTNDSIRWKKIYSGQVEKAVFFENHIYIASKKGLIVLNSEKLLRDETVNFNLKSVKVNNNDFNLPNLSNLKYNENSIEFIFDVITFSDETYNLRYSLAGKTTDTGSVNTNNVVFKKLAPGSYTLSVYPEIKDGNLLKLEIPIKIYPAFWQTRTFYILSTFIFIFLASFLIRLLFKSLKEREERKTKAEQLILEYKLIALKAQINPHFMSNCLSAIQNLIITNKLEEATAYIGKFGQLVRQILNFSTRSLITLKEELEITQLNI